MIEFRPIKLCDKKWMDELFALSDYRGSEYTFANNFNWAHSYDLQIARVGDLLLMISDGAREDGRSYSYPAGAGDIPEAIELIISDAAERKSEFKMHGLTAEHVALMQEVFPDRFEFGDYRDGFDYIYLREKLASLAGKKLHAKRNHINRFEVEHDWKYEEITPENIGECLKMNAEWCKENDCYYNEDLQEETCAGQMAFKYFVEEALQGGLIRAGERVVAFTIGEPLNSDTFDVHIEKAFSSVQGAYAIVNREFVRRLPERFIYVNREEDVGDEGLRKAKLSYEPDILLEKYWMRLK